MPDGLLLKGYNRRRPIALWGACYIVTAEGNAGESRSPAQIRDRLATVCASVGVPPKRGIPTKKISGDNTVIRKYLLTAKAAESSLNRRIVELYRKLQKAECLP